MQIRLPSFITRVVTAGALATSVALVSYFEGYSEKPYQDPGGVWTVCYGHTGIEVVPGKKYSKADCQTLLAADLAIAERAVTRLVKVSLPQNEQAALTSFVLNTGQGAFARSTLLKKLNAGDHTGACNELSKWVYDNGVKLSGLVKRRDIERRTCLGEYNVEPESYWSLGFGSGNSLWSGLRL